MSIFAPSIMEVKEHIIQQSLSLFLKKGVKQVNMDEVATNLGISKKTLYVQGRQNPTFQQFSSISLRF